MKKIIFFFILIFSNLTVAQTSNDSIKLATEINRLKTLRAKDSVKMDLLVNEIRNLITITENQRKEEKIRFTQMQDSLRFVKRLEQNERYQTKANGIPVVLYSDTLFYIYNDIASFTAAERAEHDLKAIKSLYKMPSFNADSLKVKSDGDIINIVYDKKIITSVSDLDALWSNNSQENITENYKNIITETVLKYKEKNSFNAKLIRLGQLILLVAILFTIFYVISKFIGYLNNQFKLNTTVLNKGITINNYQLINRIELTRIVDRLLWIVKFFLFIVALFIIIPFMLRLFPQTEVWVIQLNQWIKVPLNSIKDSIFNYIPNIVKMIIIFFIGKLIIRFLRFISIEISRKRLVFNGFHAEWSKPTFSILRFVLNVFIIIMIFPLLPGAESIAFKGVSVFLGILLSIGSSSAITNAISGLVITYMRPYKIGDWIKTKGTIGVVMEKSLLITRLKTFNNEDITIPNSSILNDHTINFTSIGKEKGLAVSVKVNVRYDYNPAIIEEKLLEAAKQTNRITDQIEPYVLHLSLGDLNATYELNAYTFNPENMFFIKSDLTRNVKKIFKEADIELTINSYFEIKSVNDFTK